MTYHKVGILYHPRQTAALALARSLAETVLRPLQPWLAQTGDTEACALHLPDTDLVVCVGGDGTVLWAARTVSGHGAHIVSINMGRLGFLSELDPEGAAENLHRILHGAGMLDERTLVECVLLSGSTRGQTPALALNDVVIGRAAPGRPVDLIVHVDGVHLARVRADAMIISTATGSTAYNLSAGGPVLMPQSRDLVLTPVAPHLSRMRPLVLPGDSVIEVRVETEHDAVVSADGVIVQTVKSGCVIVCRRSEHCAAFLRLGPPSDFFFKLAEHLNLSTQGRDGAG